MASDKEVRSWAQETDWRDSRGQPVSSRGVVGNAAREAYSAAQNGQPPPDYPPGMTEADFDTAEAVLPDDGPDMAEAVPRPVTPKVTSRSTVTRLSGRFRRGKPSGKPKAKPKHPRVSLADLIGSGWRIGAKMLSPLPPLYRLTRLQSEIAGPVLDPHIRGTVIDPVLQVVARHYQAGEAVGALVGPNLGIGAAMWHMTQCAKQGIEPNLVVMQACQEVTRYGLKSMMKLGGDAMAARLAAEKEDEERYGVTVDMLLEWIMSPPADQATEDDNAAKMAARFAGQPEPETMPA